MTIYTFTVPDWLPISVNYLMRARGYALRRRKQQDAQLIATYAFLAQIPKATGRRRVSARYVCSRKSRPDADNLLKSLLDGLVAAGMLRDDRHEFVELGQYEFADSEGQERSTVITLEELGS